MARRRVVVALGCSRTRKALTRNLLLAGAIYAAVSFPFEALLLEKMLGLELDLGLAIGLMAAVLFVLPVYLASQTVPMLAELINSEGKAGKASGKILFFSTSGRWPAGSSRLSVLSLIWACALPPTWFACFDGCGGHDGDRVCSRPHDRQAADAAGAVVWLTQICTAG